MDLNFAKIRLEAKKIQNFANKKTIGLDYYKAIRHCEVNYPIVPKPFLEGQCFFNIFWRRIEGGQNWGHCCIMYLYN